MYWQLSSLVEIRRDLQPGFPLTTVNGFEAQQSSLALTPIANSTNSTLASTGINFGFQSLSQQVVAYAKVSSLLLISRGRRYVA